MWSCSLPSVKDFELHGEYAIPLINANISLETLFGETDNLEILSDAEGHLTLKYKASLLSENINNLLPSIQTIGEVPIEDTVSFFPLSVLNRFVITNAVLSGDEMRFRYTHTEEEDVEIVMRIPELAKDGVPFEFSHTLKARTSTPFTEFTPSIDLDGYVYNSDQNKLSFNYDARNPEGERIKLDFVAMSFNQLTFSYGEGNYERTRFPLQGDSIAFSVYDGWKQGGIEFADPKISFNIKHTYGFPIAIKANEVVVHTVDSKIKMLEGEKLNAECVLDFPSIEEVGKVSTTQINFDQSNSNINTLFSENVHYVDYDIEAIINPADDPDILGYATDQSFFEVEAVSELPMNLKIDELVLQDTIDLKNNINASVEVAELKVITENSFPLEMKLYFVFLDENNHEIERLLVDDPLIVEPNQHNIRFINLEAAVLEKVQFAKRMVTVSEFDTGSISQDFVTLQSRQGLNIRIGLKFKL